MFIIITIFISDDDACLNGRWVLVYASAIGQGEDNNNVNRSCSDSILGWLFVNNDEKQSFFHASFCRVT
jgi:hypothetical protein